MTLRAGFFLKQPDRGDELGFQYSAFFLFPLNKVAQQVAQQVAQRPDAKIAESCKLASGLTFPLSPAAPNRHLATLRRPASRPPVFVERVRLPAR